MQPVPRRGGVLVLLCLLPRATSQQVLTNVDLLCQIVLHRTPRTHADLGSCSTHCWHSVVISEVAEQVYTEQPATACATIGPPPVLASTAIAYCPTWAATPKTMDAHRENHRVVQAVKTLLLKTAGWTVQVAGCC